MNTNNKMLVKDNKSDHKDEDDGRDCDNSIDDMNLLLLLLKVTRNPGVNNNSNMI